MKRTTTVIAAMIVLVAATGFAETKNPVKEKSTPKKGTAEVKGKAPEKRDIASVKDKPTPKKDTVVVQNLKTGQTVKVSVPHDGVKVKQTGPNTYQVKVKPGTTKKIEVKEVPPPAK